MFTTLSRNLIALGLALAATGSAWALTPADGAPQLSLYIPGSQSNDPAFGFMINNTTPANALCLNDPNPTGTGTTTHVYFHTKGANSAATNDEYSAIYCYTDSTKIPGLTGGVAPNNKTRLWISRRRLGASFVGLDAAANGTKLTYLKDPTTAVCTAFNGSYSSGGASYQWNYSCTTATSGISATAATSDVTPDAFRGVDNVTPGKTDIDASTLDNRFALGGHIIGTPVTLKLRNALQYAQVQNGTLPASCTVGNETPACVPSLSKEILVSIFSGQLYDWSTLKVKAAGAEKTLPEVVADGVTAGVAGLSNPLDTAVHVCRRENGAGQQVALLSNILKSPCLGDSSPKLAEPGGFADIQYATSLGAVDRCLGDYNNGTNGWFGTSNPAPFPNPPATGVPHGNQWAIGIQTTERNASNSASYRFIKIDGALPTGEQVFLGHYPLVGEYALSWKNNVTANQDAALNALAIYSGLPSTIAARNSDLSNHSWGQAGYIALSANGHMPPATWDPANPVTPYTRALNGTPDACAIPVVNPDFGSVELR
ncbi:hypothetical protein [Methylomonas koyamae]|uniref:hypothetical protein n=2 Tax=Methylomonas koyamae TaxID=702114 RepID=UPI001C33E1E7|nr:hypothetical protein [Methylomonas koyamae]BBL60601.1 hypothetical protein MKFW12EY_42140 [Methylomonas koyamae]